MGVRRVWAFALAAVSLALFLFGFGTALSAPEPSCGEDPSVYCLEEGYGRLRAMILGSWLGAIALLGLAVWILFAARRAPPPPAAKPAPAATPEGRRIVSAAAPRPQPSAAKPSTQQAARPASDDRMRERS